MGWIRIDPGVATSSKTYDLADFLGIERHYAVGLLVSFWGWIQASPANINGELEARGLAARLSDAVRFQGDPKKLLAALIESGFIDTAGENFVVHDWFGWNGRANEKRRSDAERKKVARKSRGQSSGRSSAGPTDVRAHTETETETETDSKSSGRNVGDFVRIEYARELTVALNTALEANPLVQAPRELATSNQVEDVREWMDDGIPLDVAKMAIERGGRTYRPRPNDPQPRALRYFDRAIRNAWEKKGGRSRSLQAVPDSDNLKRDPESGVLFIETGV